MFKLNRSLVIAILFGLLSLTIAVSVISAVYADQKVRQEVFVGIEIDRFSTLYAGYVFVPLLTQTPGIFEPTLTAIAALKAHTSVVKDFNRVPMVEVPAGCFFMGSSLYPETQPISQQCFNTVFWIGQTEVTRAQYQQFLDEGGYNDQSYWSDDGWAWRSDNNTSPLQWTEPRNQVAELPVTGVNWYEAFAYTTWLTRHYHASGLIAADKVVRLPTEAEWEYAARGPDSLQFPWGNEWILANAKFDVSDVVGRVVKVGSIPAGVSWVGALDMSGNVWEWLNTIYDPQLFPSPYRSDDGREEITSKLPRMLRGGVFPGGFYADIQATDNSYRINHVPDYRYHHSGFRVVIASPIGSS